MLRDADSAMYRAKSKGGAHYAIFDDSMHASVMKELELEADLKHAIENKEWQIHYQPIVTLPNKNIISMEALLRWDHPRHGLMQPLDFIHVAEETGLINQIGDYVLLTACQQVKEWRTKAHPNLVASINLSARQFQSRELVEYSRARSFLKRGWKETHSRWRSPKPPPCTILPTASRY